MSSLQAMQGQGKYVEHFIDQVTKWLRSLGTVEAVLYDWLDVQAKWTSLEAIFTGSEDIRVQLPEDSERFDEIDSQWKTLMQEARITPNVIEACSRKGRSGMLKTVRSAAPFLFCGDYVVQRHSRFPDLTECTAVDAVRAIACCACARTRISLYHFFSTL